MHLTIKHVSLCHLAGIVASVMLIIVQPQLPEKRTTIHPNSNGDITLYSDDQWGGKSNARWVDRNRFAWHCSLIQSEFYPVCGFAIALHDRDGIRAIRDFTRYEAIDLSIRYQGEGPKLRMYLRNHNPIYSDINDDDSYKFNSFDIDAKELNNGITRVKLSEFIVAQWWLEERNIRRQNAAPEFDNIVAFGFDLPSPHVFGQYDIEINKIELIGKALPKDVLYFWIIVAWLALLTLEASYFLIILPRLNRKLKSLPAKPPIPNQPQSDGIKIDVSGLLERSELTPVIENRYLKLTTDSRVSLCLINFPADSADKTLKMCALTARQVVGSAGVLARWDPNTLLMLCFNVDEPEALKMVEKIKDSIAKAENSSDTTDAPQVAIGLATSNAAMSFMQLAQHGDEALYKSKHDNQGEITLYRKDET